MNLQTEFPGAAPLKDELTIPERGAVTPAASSAPGSDSGMAVEVGPPTAAAAGQPAAVPVPYGEHTRHCPSGKTVSAVATSPQPSLPKLLLPGEAELFTACKAICHEKLNAVLEFAAAIGTIRDKRLYRVEFDTFEDFCRIELKLTARSVRRLISQGGVLQVIENQQNNGSQMGPILPLPKSSDVARPLIGLSPGQILEAWSEACATAPDGAPNRSLVEQVVREYRSRLGLSAPKRKPVVEAVEVPKQTEPLTAEAAEVNGSRQPKSQDKLKLELQTRIDEESGEAAARRNQRRFQIIAENLTDALNEPGVNFSKLELEIKEAMAVAGKLETSIVEQAARIKRRGAVRDHGRPLGKGNYKSVVHLLNRASQGKAA